MVCIYCRGAEARVFRNLFQVVVAKASDFSAQMVLMAE